MLRIGPISLRVGRRLAVALVTLALISISVLAIGSGNPTMLTPTEAKILIYVSPAAAAERERGFDIAIERQTSSKLDQSNYYYFWVYNAKRRQPSGSVTLGYYAVNKRTGQVWETDEKREIASPLMHGIEVIIRHSHHIDRATIERYGNSPF